jgi:hypothetical protein
LKAEARSPSLTSTVADQWIKSEVMRFFAEPVTEMVRWKGFSFTARQLVDAMDVEHTSAMARAKRPQVLVFVVVGMGVRAHAG